MSLEPLPETLTIPIGDLIDLGVEYWRLSTGVGTSSASAGARHAVRRIGDLLKRHTIEVRALDGHPFDAGLAARVVHTEEDPTQPAGRDEIIETVSPMVLWRGRVVRTAEVVTRRGTKGS